ncbi:MAG TPA: sigma-70 family RNA polymerase sigma factor, partial [Candidatus Binatia bacterium]|nr:sigma-70 family RNA polymerase sigma factor [Candidatus Binatia bacterium]
MDDWQLLNEYVGTGSESAFRSLVERHINLVHSVAMRHVRDADRAREVSQAVFILLARKAASLRRSVVLSAWLYRTARFVAARAVRSEQRRSRREQEAVRMQTLNYSPETVSRLVPALDEALDELNEKDRQPLLLRFYEEQ